MQLVTQIWFSVSMLAEGMFIIITEFSIYGQNSEKWMSRLTRADCTCVIFIFAATSLTSHFLCHEDCIKWWHFLTCKDNFCKM